MKKTLFVLLIIIFIILIGIIIWDMLNGEKIVQTPKGNVLSLSIKSIYESDKLVKIQAEYPQFDNVDPTFNQEIEKMITDKINEFKTDSKENWEARRATASPEYPVPENPEQPFDFQAFWTPTQLNNKYISFVINLYYFSGGAHGNEEIFTFNYDLNGKKEITINDFLGNSPDNLKKVSELAAQSVESELASKVGELDDSLKNWIKEGTAPNEENFNNFNFNGNALIIYFQKYQVAPGAVGTMTVSLYNNFLEANSVTSTYFE